MIRRSMMSDLLRMTRWILLGIFFTTFLGVNSPLALWAQGSPSRVQEGIQALKDDRLNDALLLFREVVAESPDSAEGFFYLGVVFSRMHQLPEAEQAFLRSFTLNPKELEPQLRLGLVYEELGKPSDAVTAYQTVIQKSEDQILVQKARQLLTRLEIRTHYTRAQDFVREGKVQEALQELEMVTSLDPKSAEPFFAMGELYLTLRQWDQAIVVFQKAVENDVGHYRAHLRLGRMFENRQEWEKARESYEKVIELKKEGPEAGEAAERLVEVGRQIRIQELLQEISTLLEKHENEKALQRVQDLFAVDANHPLAFYFRGYIADLQERPPEELIPDFQKTIELDPSFLPAYVKLGMAYQQAGDLEKAIELYQHVLDEAKTEDETVTLARLQIKIAKDLKVRKSALGETASVLKKGEEALPEAIPSLEKAVSAYPRDVDSFLTLAVIYLKTEEKEKALDTLRRAVKHNPKSFKAYFHLGRFLSDMGQISEAQYALDQARTLARGTEEIASAEKQLREVGAKLHFQTAEKETNRGDYETALREIQTVITLYPEDASAYLSQGVIYDRMNKTEEAIISLRKAIELSPGYVNARFQLAIVFEGRGRFEEARKEYDAILSMNPDEKTAERTRARLGDLDRVAKLYEQTRVVRQMFEDQKYEETLRETQTLILLDPSNYLAYLFRGLASVELKRPLDAIDALKKAVELHPKAVTARYLLGKVYLDESRFEESREEFERVIKDGEGTREADFAGKYLKRLNPLTYSLGYGQTFDSNVTQSRKPVVAVSSSLSAGANYVLARTRLWHMTAGGSAQQSTYFRSQGVGNSLSGSLSGQYRLWEPWTLSGNIGIGYGFFDREKTSRSRSLSLSAGTAGTGQIPSRMSLGFSFIEAHSFRSASTDTQRMALSLSGTQQFTSRDQMNFGYTFVSNVNLASVGSNFAYRSNGLSLNYNRQIHQDLSGSLGLALTHLKYSNPDSSTLFRQFRQTLQTSLSAGLSYPLSEDVGFSMSYAYTTNSTNISLSPQERLELTDILASPIPTVGGDSKGHTLSIRFSVSF